MTSSKAESKFCASVPELQRAWDSTSLKELLFCPRRYYYRMVEGWVSKKDTAALTFGQIFHSSLEVYDKILLTGDKEKARREAVRHAMIMSKDSETAFAEDPIRTRFRLIRTVVWYMEKYHDDPAATIMLEGGQPAVELSFRIPLERKTPDGDLYILCGHMDGLIEYAGQVMVRERKHTTKTLNERYFNGYSPDAQISIYSFASQVIYQVPAKHVLIDAAQVAVNFSEFSRGFADRTPTQLAEFMRNLSIRIIEAERYAEARYWPMNEANCWFCLFQPVCSKDPAARPAALRDDFKQVDPWNPLDSR